MFENVTRALTRQLNPRGDLTPLDSLIDFKRFHPFCLVLRKRKSTLFWGARYVCTDYTFLDILEPGSSPSGQPWPRTWGPREGQEPANQEDLKLSLPRGQGWESSSQKVLEGGREEEAPQPSPLHLLPPADPTDSGNFGFKNMLDARVEGEVDVPKTVKVKGTAGLSRNSTLEVQTLSVAPKALETLHQER